jgi:ferredoxin
VCPVYCFYEIESPAMLVIDPDTCIDCQACVPACPVHAIWFQQELPPEYAEWLVRNKELFPLGENIGAPKEPLQGAKTLEQVQAEERGRGWSISEPSAV